MEMCPSTLHHVSFETAKLLSFFTLEKIPNGHKQKHISMLLWQVVYYFPWTEIKSFLSKQSGVYFHFLGFFMLRILTHSAYSFV